MKVADAEDASTKKNLGSPTIRINGIDLGEKEANYMFGCRVYTIDGKLTGTPTTEFIKEKLSNLLS